jgi:hypothetical protein
MPGTNIGTGNYVPPDLLKSRGYTFVRLVSLPNAEDYAALCRARQIAVLAVVTGESQGYVLGNADVHQFDNERDLDQSPSDYQLNATFYQRTYPHLNWIACGMAKGSPLWWRDVAALGLPGFSGFAVHPYGKTASQAATLINSYKSYTPNMDCWITEWVRPAAEIPGYQKMLRERAVHAFWFCEDCGVEGFSAPPLIFHV